MTIISTSGADYSFLSLWVEITGPGVGLPSSKQSQPPLQDANTSPQLALYGLAIGHAGKYVYDILLLTRILGCSQNFLINGCGESSGWFTVGTVGLGLQGVPIFIWHVRQRLYLDKPTARRDAGLFTYATYIPIMVLPCRLLNAIGEADFVISSSSTITRVERRAPWDAARLAPPSHLRTFGACSAQLSRQIFRTAQPFRVVLSSF